MTINLVAIFGAKTIKTQQQNKTKENIKKLLVRPGNRTRDL